jgi:hypothetical protein
MVIKPVDAMAAHHHEPAPTPMVTFLNAAESVRSTGVYGAGIGIILAGFLLVGFEARDENLHPEGEKDGA